MFETPTPTLPPLPAQHYIPPHLTPSEIPPSLHHLTPQDQHTFLQNSFGAHRTIPFPVVHHAFEWHARTQPDTICIEHEAYGDYVTYGQVESLSNRLSRRITTLVSGARSSRATGGDADDVNDDDDDVRICILARRSVHFVIAILAVLKSRAQYVPIDAATVTDEALSHIIHDSEPGMVLVMEEFEDRLLYLNDNDDSVSPLVPVLCIERAVREDEALGADDSKPEDETTPEDGCYVIYTSGTTGVPKGVDVRHIGVSNVICAPPGNVHMKPGTRVAHLLNIAFDMGAWEILSSLYNGCTLCLRGNTFKEWVRLLKSVEVVISTPSILARHDPKEYQNIKHVIVGGEVCPQSLADSWGSYTQFNNCCGPTEISVCNTIQPHTPGYPLSIGTPIPNTSVYILSQDYDPDPDPDSHPDSSTLSLSPPPALPIGETGCMWVGGIGVSKGYLNLSSKTRERYHPDPFRHSEPNSELRMMMFNTNDLGRWREDGQLEHCGRADDQVKVKGGFRVELDGVASAMMRCTKIVSRAVALLVDGALWGFVVRKPAEERQCGEDSDSDEDEEEEEEDEIEQVEKCTREVMSYYAVPERWMIMDEFPMTRNGKVDKRTLITLAREKEEQHKLNIGHNKGASGNRTVDSSSSSSSSSSSASSTSIASVSGPPTPTAELEDLIDATTINIEDIHPTLDIDMDMDIIAAKTASIIPVPMTQTQPQPVFAHS